MKGSYEEVERLHHKIAELEEIISELKGSRFPLNWRLTPYQETILSLILKRSTVSRNAIASVLGNQNVLRDKDVAPETVSVHVCYIRRKLKPLGIEIETRYRTGYFMSEEAKDKVRSMMVPV